MKLRHFLGGTALAISTVFIAPAYANTPALQQLLNSKYPDMPIKVTAETPMQGVYELQLDDGSLVYTDSKADYFMVGNLVDFKNQINLTQQREQELNKVDVKQLPLNQAVKTVKGNGKHTLYIFTDPDCPYCKQLEKELAKMNNLTIYTFLYPIKDQHHTTKTQIAEKVWCSSNPSKAWADFMLNGTVPTANANCDNPISKNLALGNQLKVTGTPTIILQDGRRIAGAMPAEQLQKVLDGSKSN
ncbi:MULTISPECIES: DsbC family protein [unclassified Acinetobacter]|uniref:DsbC family protein n=1 Tax=unclassified Acinetobacter TaxID=196816 RepID=UPI0035B70E87